MRAEKTQPFCPCSRVLNWTGKGLIFSCKLYLLLDIKGVRMIICMIHMYWFSSIKLGTVSYVFHLYVGRTLFKGWTNNERYSRMAMDGRCGIHLEPIIWSLVWPWSHANPLDSIVYKWDAVPHGKNLDMTWQDRRLCNWSVCLLISVLFYWKVIITPPFGDRMLKNVMRFN